MSKMSQADFFFGAALSVLFNSKMVPALVENGEERRIYEVDTNNGHYLLYMKYRAKTSTDNNDLTSWQFIFADDEIEEFRKNLNEETRLILICGKDNLRESEIVFLNNDEIKKVLCDTTKKNITIGRKKHSRNFYISMGGGRTNDIHIPANRLNLDVLA